MEQKELKILIVRLSPEKYVNLSFTHKMLAKIAKDALLEKVLIDYFFFPDAAAFNKFSNAKNSALSKIHKMRPCEFDIIAISNSFTLEFFNVPQFLKMSSIPLTADERLKKTDMPLVICGGVNTPAIAPLTGGVYFDEIAKSAGTYIDNGRSALIDAFFLGEAEANFSDFLKELVKIGNWRAFKETALLKLSLQIKGLYLPFKFIHKFKAKNDNCAAGSFFLQKIFNLYDDEKLRGVFKDELCLSGAVNTNEEKLDAVKTAVLYDIDNLEQLSESVSEESGGIGSVPVEITRGCPSMCAFCKEGYTQKPYREKSLEAILKNAEYAKKNTSVGIMNLYSYNFNDHSRIHEIVEKLVCSGMVPRVKSQRIDRAARMPELLSFLSKAGSASPTFAVEGISERLRSYLSKNIEKKVLYDFVVSIFKSRPRQIKLFFIITGLENEADFNELNDFISFMVKQRRANMLSTNFIISLMPLVNPAKTPLQFAPAPDSVKVFKNAKKISDMFSGIDRLTVRLSIDKTAYELTQILESGGRELTSIICNTALTENFAYYENVPELILKKFKQALLKMRIDITENFKEKEITDVLPSDDRDYGVSREFLYKAWLNSKQFKDMSRCPRNGEFPCQNCGACDFKNKIYENIDLSKRDREFAKNPVSLTDFDKNVKAVCEIYSDEDAASHSNIIYNLGGERTFNIIEDARARLFSDKEKFYGKNFYYVSYYDFIKKSGSAGKKSKDSLFSAGRGRIFYCADNSFKNLDFIMKCNYVFARVYFNKNVKIAINKSGAGPEKEVLKTLEHIVSILNPRVKNGRLKLAGLSENVISFGNLDGLKKHVNMPFIAYDLKLGEFYSIFKICPETINMLEKAEIIEYIRAFEYNVKDNKSVCGKCGRVYYMPLPERSDDGNDGCFICRAMPDYFRK